MRDVVARVLGRDGPRLLERDVRDDPELEKRYVFEIPVLLWGATEVAGHRIEEGELRARLSRLGFFTSRS